MHKQGTDTNGRWREVICTHNKWRIRISNTGCFYKHYEKRQLSRERATDEKGNVQKRKRKCNYINKYTIRETQTEIMRYLFLALQTDKN